MHTLEAGNRVKPSLSFDFELYSGPTNQDSRGTVTEVGESLVLVQWDGGEVWDHSVEGEGDDDFAVLLDA